MSIPTIIITVSIPFRLNPLGNTKAPYIKEGLMASYSYLNSDNTTIYDLTGNGYDLLIENRTANDGFGIKAIKAKAVKAMDWLTNNVTVEILACRIEDYAYYIGGTRTIRVFSDASATKPISDIYEMENPVTSTAAMTPGDPVGSTSAWGSKTTIPINATINNTITIGILSKWGIYYAGLQEIEIEGHYI